MTNLNKFNNIVNFGDLCNALRSEVINADNNEIDSIFNSFWLDFSTNYKDRCKRIAKKISNVDNDEHDEKIINSCLDNLNFLLRNDFNLFVMNLTIAKRNVAKKLLDKYQNLYKSSSTKIVLGDKKLQRIHYFDYLITTINLINLINLNEKITPDFINDVLMTLKKEELIDVYSIVHHDTNLQKFGQNTVFIVDNLEDVYFQIIKTALIDYYYNN